MKTYSIKGLLKNLLILVVIAVGLEIVLSILPIANCWYKPMFTGLFINYLFGFLKGASNFHISKNV